MCFIFRSEFAEQSGKIGITLSIRQDKMTRRSLNASLSTALQWSKSKSPKKKKRSAVVITEKNCSWKEPEDPSNADHLQASEDALMFDIGWFAQVRPKSTVFGPILKRIFLMPSCLCPLSIFVFAANSCIGLPSCDAGENRRQECSTGFP